MIIRSQPRVATKGRDRRPSRDCGSRLRVTTAGRDSGSRPRVATQGRDWGLRAPFWRTRTREARRGPRGSRGHPPPPWVGDPQWTQGGPRGTAHKAELPCCAYIGVIPCGARVSRAPDPWASTGHRAVGLAKQPHAQTLIDHGQQTHTQLFDRGVVMCLPFE